MDWSEEKKLELELELVRLANEEGEAMMGSWEAAICIQTRSKYRRRQQSSQSLL